MSLSGRVGCLALAALLTAAAQAEAGTIRITLRTFVAAAVDGVRVEIRVRNDGDESALRVTPSILFENAQSDGVTVPSLGAGATAADAITVPVSDAAIRRGRWPLFVHLRYEDGGGHPFEAVHVATFTMGETPSDRGPAIKVANVRLRDAAAVRAALDVTTARAPVHVTFFAPDSVRITPLVTDVPLPPNGGGETAASATIRNETATPNSRLPLFVVGETDVDGVHRTVIASASIDVVSDRAPLDMTRRIAVLVGALLLTWIVLAVPSLVRRRRGRHA